MTREFKLVNEKGQEYSLMDIYNHALLTDPDGLGYSFNTSYEKIGDTFISYDKIQNQMNFNGNCNFLNYDNYSEFVNFVEKAEELSIAYVVPYKNKPQTTYYKDVNIQSISKTEINSSGVLSCPVTFEMLSLWYEKKEYRYNMASKNNEVRWAFPFSKSRFMNYNERKLTFENNGHTEAPFYLEIDGEINKPHIVIQNDSDNTIFELLIPIKISQYEKFIYSSIDGKIEISKQNVDGSKESLFKQQYIDINKNNIFKLPQGISKITLESENEIPSANILIMPFYRTV